jgi:hypothetical protein
LWQGLQLIYCKDVSRFNFNAARILADQWYSVYGKYLADMYVKAIASDVKQGFKFIRRKDFNRNVTSISADVATIRLR